MDINMTNNDYYEFETTNPNLKGLVVISHGMADLIITTPPFLLLSSYFS